MALSYNTNVIEQCRISPPSGSVSTTSLPLTIFDAIFLPLPLLQSLFFYELPYSKDHFTSTILPSIKLSLSLALQQFFPLAGNLAWPQNSPRPEIHYVDGDSVSVTVAESDYDFYDLVDDTHAKNVGVFYQLVPRLVNSPSEKLSPLNCFQITLFPNKGISIGITYNHVVADGMAHLHFTNTWASICKSILETGSPSVLASLLLPPPCISKSVVRESSHGIDVAICKFMKKLNFTRENFYTSKHQTGAADNVFATFLMRPTDIKRLKQWVLARLQEHEKENAGPLHLSTFVLTCAYVWVCLVRAQWPNYVAAATEEDEMECFVFPVECRARLDPPVPATYFGNCINFILVKAKRSDLLEEQGIPMAARLIGNSIQDTKDGSALIDEVESFLSSDVELPRRYLSVAGSTRFRAYDPDFGWGRPRKVRFVSIAASGAMSLCQSRTEAGAVEVGLVGDKEQLDAFASSYTSTMEAFSPCDGVES